MDETPEVARVEGESREPPGREVGDPSARSEARLAPPKVLASSSWELFEELGRGATGVVYRARQRSMDRDVAIKCLRDASASPRAIARFRREARAIARVSHENIVAVHAMAELDGRPCLVLELLRGGDLRQRAALLRERPLLAAEIIATVARAVDRVHRAKILHRDIKPSNILFDENGEPHLSDFGTARLLDEDSGLTRAGEPLGSAGYVAPELARGDHAAVGPRSDVYSLGAVLYELLTGRPPHQGPTVYETLRLATGSRVTPPRRIDARVPVALESILLRSLAREPRDRQESAVALANELEDWCRGHGRTSLADACRSAWGRRSARTRGLALWSLTLVVLLALAGGSVLSSLGVGRGRWRRVEAFHGVPSRSRYALREDPSWRVSSPPFASTNSSAALEFVRGDARRVFVAVGSQVLEKQLGEEGIEHVFLVPDGVEIIDIATSPGRSLLALLEEKGGLLIVDSRRRSLVRRFEVAVGSESVRFVSDEIVLVSSWRQRSGELWSARTGERCDLVREDGSERGPGDLFPAVLFSRAESADSRSVLNVSAVVETTEELRRLASREPEEPDAPSLESLSQVVDQVASEDGASWLARRAEGEVEAWGLERGALARRWRLGARERRNLEGGPVEGGGLEPVPRVERLLAISNDGNWAAWLEEPSVIVLRASDGSLSRLALDGFEPRAAALTAGGERLAVLDGRGGLRVLDRVR